MKILLTGASGFIGNAFLRAAIRNGHEVAGLYRPGTEPLVKLPGQEILSGAIEVPPWSEVVDFEPECVVHSAWISTPGEYLESPLNRDHLKWSMAFIDRVVDLGVQHVVGIGTCIEYEIGDKPLSEDQTSLRPRSLYAATKNELRIYAESLARRHSVSLTWARLFYPFGPGEHPLRLCTSLITRMKEGSVVELRTPDSRKDFIFIDDVAAALLKIAECRPNCSINIGSGSSISVAEIAHIIAATLDREEPQKIANSRVQDDYPCVVANTTRLRGLGWRPMVAVEDGLKEMIRRLTN